MKRHPLRRLAVALGLRPRDVEPDPEIVALVERQARADAKRNERSQEIHTHVDALTLVLTGHAPESDEETER